MGSRKRREGGLRNFRNDLCYDGYWDSWIRCLSSSHVYCWNRRRYSGLLYSSNYNYCGSDRNEDFQLTWNSSRNSTNVYAFVIMSRRICLPFHYWGFYWSSSLISPFYRIESSK